MEYTTLSQEDIQHFLDYGYVVVKDCFSREFAQEWTDLAYKRLGYEKGDPATWEVDKIHMPSMNRVEVKQWSPKAWGAMCDLVGGEERIKDADNYTWGDGFILNFKFGADRPWQEPSAEVKGWHKDGDFFFHFLDSPEQGLLCVVVWNDWVPQGGGTFIIADSVPVVADFLKDQTDGVHPYSDGWKTLPAKCSDFRELVGETGDVVLLHPYMLHASSQNVSGKPRFMTNPCLTLAEPMDFNRENPDDFSPIELAVLKGLGVERLDFQLTSPRREHVPERIKRQREMLEKEKARLAAEE